MRSIIFFLFIFFLIQPSLCHAQYSSSESRPTQLGNAESVPGELIVKFKTGVVKYASDGQIEFSSESLQNLFKQLPIKAVTPVYRNKSINSDLGRTFKISFSGSVNLDHIARLLKRDAGAEYAEPNRIYHTQAH